MSMRAETCLAVCYALVAAALATFAGCGGRAVAQETPPSSSDPPDASADAAEASTADQTVPDTDAASFPDTATSPDGSPSSCTCPFPQVWVHHECTPTMEIGCADDCHAGATCANGSTCDSCAASSSCNDGDCRAACVSNVPVQGPILNYHLRITPTVGSAGQPQTILIQGFPFYIGALWYGVNVGGADVTDTQAGAGTCSMTVTVPPLDPGMVPVWVTQYGGQEPWVLAGFYTASAGDIPECAQPGVPCGPDDECCETADSPVLCTMGRCALAP